MNRILYGSEDMLVIGLISGTSADGVDAALMEITGRDENLRIQERRFRTYRFPPALQDRIFRVSHKRVSAGEIALLDFRLGEVFADAALKLCRDSDLPAQRVSLIGSHGQTIFHAPRRASFQIAEPSIIAQRTGITTIADFRPADIAAGGEGAPLSCLLHYHLFKKKGVGTLIVNIGGISNFTLVPASMRLRELVAFDTGPGNMLVDGIVREGSSGRRRYDRGGGIASRGRVNAELLSMLLRNRFVLKPPPKSTGREVFGENFIDKIRGFRRKRGLSFEDAVATATAFTVESIYLNYERFIKRYGVDRIVITGGGVRNDFMMGMLRRRFAPLPVKTFEDFGMNSDSAEALAFGLLAYETFHRRPGNITSATGAERKHVLGKIIYP